MAEDGHSSLDTVIWLDEAERTEEASKVAAAQVQVLGLAPIQAKLGPKWDRLSELVHKLFERAVERVQGPSDYIIRLNELSYAATFHDLSIAQTRIACISIAKEICQLLFGDQIEEVSVRTLVAEITTQDLAKPTADLEKLLERHGSETIVTRSIHAKSDDAVVTKVEASAPGRFSRYQQIECAHALLERFGLRAGFFPVWDLQKGESSSLFLVPFRGRADHVQVSGRRALDSVCETEVADAEIVLLNAAAAYALRIHDAQKVCAVGVGVSYATLSGLSGRVRYLSALQKVRVAASSPLLLKIEQVPAGVPLARLGELIAMMGRPNIRIIVEFQDLTHLPEIDLRLGAIGIGGASTLDLSSDQASFYFSKLSRLAIGLRVFTFVDRLDDTDILEAAIRSNVRFGTGGALGARHFAGVENVPAFPLSRDSCG